MLILINPAAGFNSSYVLKPKDADGFQTKEECLTAMAYVATEMAKAYPGDESYKLACRLKTV